MPSSNLARSLPVPDPSPQPALPARAPARGKAPTAAASRRSARWPVVLILAGLLALNAWGLPYYAASDGERVRHALHRWFRSSGYVGQSAGIAAFLVFTFLWLYPLRKRWKQLAWTGSVGRWLDVHVVAALGLPLLLTAHAAWRSEGLIGLGFDAMLVVCASGIVGRYLYTRIPRTKSGIELTREEVSRQRQQLVERIAQTTGLTVSAIEQSLAVQQTSVSSQPSLWKGLKLLVLSDWSRWRLARALPARWATLSPSGHRVSHERAREAVQLARREIALEQQTQLLDVTHRIFRFWHVAHKPFAITALFAVIVHIVVVVAVGATWFY